MKHSWTRSLVFVFLSTLSLSALAEENSEKKEVSEEETESAQYRVRALVETDPATFVLGGFSAHLRIPIADSGWTIGAGIYGLNIPDFVTDLSETNRSGGYHSSIEKAYALFVDYHFSGEPEGWFVGMQSAYQYWGIEKDGSSEDGNLGTILLMPRGGYLWRPIQDSQFYLLPWVGAGAQLELFRTEGAAGYEQPVFTAFATVHVGYRF